MEVLTRSLPSASSPEGRSQKLYAKLSGQATGAWSFLWMVHKEPNEFLIGHEA